jgi:hypothetical protein
MKHYFLLLALSIAVALPTVAVAESWKRIKSEEQFRALAVDRKVANENGWVLSKSNGDMTGNINGQGKLKGKWAWGNGFFCRNAIVGKNDLGQNCQTVHVAGNKIRFTRDQGKGQQSVWEIQ